MGSAVNRIMQSAATGTGNGITIDVTELGTLVFQLSGTFVGTVTFEATVDNVNWVAVQVKNRNTGKLSTTATAPGLYSLSIAGLNVARARVSAYTSGNVTVHGYATPFVAEQDVSGVDPTTFARTTIDYPHSEIHNENHYYLEGFTTLALNAHLYVKLVTPNTGKWGHFTWDIESSGILTTYLYEAVSGGMAGGAGVTPLNNNRNSTNTSGLTITSGVAVATDLGTTVSQAKWGSRQIGGGQKRESEIVLKQNAIYLRDFLSGENSNIVSFRASWYEHTNRV